MQNVKQLRPELDLHDYESVKNYHYIIRDKLKLHLMPYKDPWNENNIRLFAAWICDGLKDRRIEKLSTIVPFYPADIEVDADGYPKNPYELNFDDHVKPMFGFGHKQRMNAIKADLNLHNYESMCNYKIMILRALTRENISGSSLNGTGNGDKRMPQYNPWPKKNIALFYAWAAQGEKPRENAESQPSPPSSQENANELIEIREAVGRYKQQPTLD